jgi:cyclohexa-1,5-dienecarbonyl-CoA hydratase
VSAPANGSGAPAPLLGRLETIEVAWLEEQRVLRILLDRPKGNVLTRAMMAEIGAALAAQATNPRLRLVVLRGAGGNFSFGASVEEHTRDQVAGLLRTFHALARQLAGFAAPVAALVEGRCLGGAFELALCCHFLVAARSARFACPEIKLGVYPPVLAAIGHLRLGALLAERLLLTGEEIDAETAARLGLVAALLPGAADAELELLAWYRSRLEPLSAFTLREATRVTRECSGLLAALDGPLDLAERHYLERIVESHDGNEGLAAFLEGRPVRWRDA